MDESKLTDEVVTKLLEWAGDAESFAAEHAPLAIDEILRWGAAGEAVSIIVFSVPFAIASWVLGGFAQRAGIRWKTAKDEGDYMSDSDMLCVACWAGTIGTALIAFLGAAESIMTIAKVLVAPRLYVLSVLGELAG